MPNSLTSATRTFTLSDFDFGLPPALIAQHPPAERSGSRLLDGTGVSPTDRRFTDLPGLLRPGDAVLIKGSRGVGLETVAAELAARDGETK